MNNLFCRNPGEISEGGKLMSGSGDPYPVEQYAMIKTTKTDFRLFKKWFLYYADKAGLTEWRFDLVHGDCGDAYTTINSNSDGKVVTVCFNEIWCGRSGMPLNERNIKNTAKHEVNELLVSDLVDLAEQRFVTRKEIERVRHTLVRRLDTLVKD